MSIKFSGWICVIAMLILAHGCVKPVGQEALAEELMNTDREFSDLSADKGMNYAFLSYLADDGVLLRPNRMPVEGADKIKELFSMPDSIITLSWEPLFGYAAASGDLGYTYGTYHYESLSPEGALMKDEGTYVTIWRKNKDGKWKFVLDSGNSGLSRKTE